MNYSLFHNSSCLGDAYSFQASFKFFKRLINISSLIVEVLNDQNLFTESNLANWFSSYVQFCSGGHFSQRDEAAWYLVI